VFLATVVASGSKVPVSEAAITALLGYSVVFLGLFLLMVVVMIMGKMMQSAAARKEAPAAPTPAPAAEAAEPVGTPAPGSAGKLKLYDTSDRDAAMIMAIVANKMGKPLNELRFISIKEVK